MTDTPEFRDRGKRTFELVVHRNFVTHTHTHTHYHFGTLELVTFVHQNFSEIYQAKMKYTKMKSTRLADEMYVQAYRVSVWEQSRVDTLALVCELTGCTLESASTAT